MQSTDIDAILDDARRRSQSDDETKAAEGRCVMAIMEPLADWLDDEFKRDSSDTAVMVAAMTMAISTISTTATSLSGGDDMRAAAVLSGLKPVLIDRLDLAIKTHIDFATKN